MSEAVDEGLITGVDLGEKVVFGLGVADVGAAMQKFHWPDYTVFIVMLLLCIGIGIYFGFFQAPASAQEYLVGSRTMATFPVAISLIARYVTIGVDSSLLFCFCDRFFSFLELLNCFVVLLRCHFVSRVINVLMLSTRFPFYLSHSIKQPFKFLFGLDKTFLYHILHSSFLVLCLDRFLTIFLLLNRCVVHFWNYSSKNLLPTPLYISLHPKLLLPKISLKDLNLLFSKPS